MTRYAEIKSRYRLRKHRRRILAQTTLSLADCPDASEYTSRPPHINPRTWGTIVLDRIWDHYLFLIESQSGRCGLCDKPAVLYVVLRDTDGKPWRLICDGCAERPSIATV